MRWARRREQWYHTAHLLAIVAEVNRDPDKRSEPYSADDFPLPEPGKRPMPKGRRSPPSPELMEAVRQMYPGPATPKTQAKE